MARLDKAEQEFGIDPHVVVALIGVETYYGRITGSKDVFTSLTTLAFDYPRRETYFQSELEAYLLLAREEGWNIGETKGSYNMLKTVDRCRCQRLIGLDIVLSPFMSHTDQIRLLFCSVL